MTLSNLKYALYLNNKKILERISALNDSITELTGTDIVELKNSIDELNDLIEQTKNELDELNTTTVDTHVNDTVIHVTQDDKDLWNSTLDNAKDYAKGLFDAVTSFNILIVDELPSEPEEMVIYFKPNSKSDTQNYYDEYMYINSKWEIIGSTYIDLSPYVLTADLNKELAKYLLKDDFNTEIADYIKSKDLTEKLKSYALATDLHTHTNKSVLDKLSETSDGTLLYNGSEVKGGGSDITVSEQTGNAIQTKADGIFVEDKTDDINAITEDVSTLNRQITRVRYAQKIINDTNEHYFISFDNNDGTYTGNYEMDIEAGTSFIKALKDFGGTEINSGMTITDDGYITLTTGTWDLTLGTLNAGTANIWFNWQDRDGNVYGNKGFVPGGRNSDYDLDSNAIITVDADETLDIIPITEKNCTVEPDYTFVKVIKTSNKTIDPVDYVNTTQGIEDTPVGHILTCMANNAPSHYLKCDGTEYNIADYPYLADHFNNEFGSINYFGGDGIDTFKVPDLRGEFLRGTGTNGHSDCGNGANVGIHQVPTLQTNVFYANTKYLYVYKSDSSKNSTVAYADTQKAMVSQGSVAVGNSAYTVGKSEFTARPTNTSVLYCIKYEPTYYMTVVNSTTQDEVDAIKKQNELLQEQNNLLQQQIDSLNTIVDSINKESV